MASCLCTDLAAQPCYDRWTLARFSKSRRELKAPWRARQMEKCNHQRCSSRHWVYFKGFLTLAMSADLSGWQGHCRTDCNSPLKMCKAKRCKVQMWCIFPFNTTGGNIWSLWRQGIWTHHMLRNLHGDVQSPQVNPGTPHTKSELQHVLLGTCCYPAAAREQKFPLAKLSIHSLVP